MAGADVGVARSPIEIVARYPSIRESRFFAEYTGRVAANRDMHTIVTAEGETGVGKTTVAASICMLLDFHPWTADKATLDPAEYAHLYDKQDLCDDHSDRGHLPLDEFERCADCEYHIKPGSWLLGDEWEQAMDARNSTSKENRVLSHNYAGKRYRQIFSCVTLPSKNWLDKRMGISIADFWIQCLEADQPGKPMGKARVYRLKEEEHYETSFTKKTETITWPVLDGTPEMKKIHHLKRERFEGGQQPMYIHRDEFKEAKKNFWNKATKKARYNLVKGMSTYGLSDQAISDILKQTNEIEGIGRRRVNDLVNSESFEEVYSS